MSQETGEAETGTHTAEEHRREDERDEAAPKFQPRVTD